MFCGNCGNKLDDDAIFCPECGNKVRESENIVISNNNFSRFENNAETKSREYYTDSLEPNVQVAQENSKKHNKFLRISIFIVGILIVGLILFCNFHDSTKISWNEEQADIKLKYTSARVLNLAVLCFDESGNSIDNIEFFADGGETIPNGVNVEWKLPSTPGIYKITAKAPSGKKITKKIEVIQLAEDKLYGMKAEEVDNETADNDNDGIVNAEEIKIGTNINNPDTDKDGLIDWYEIEISKTDPLNPDTDGDGINDGNEIELGLDPLNKTSGNSGVIDGKRKLSYTFDDEKNGLKVTIEGKGNIATSTVDVFENNAFSNINGMLGKVYDLYSNGTIENATVEIKYDLDEIKANGLNEDNLSIYYFDENTRKMEIVPTVIDKDNKTLTIELKHFSKYLIGDKEKVVLDYETQILFAIDNSRSMYTKNQLIAVGEKAVTGAYVPADPNFKRLTLTNQLISMLDGDYKFSVSEFSGTNVSLQDFTSNKKALYNALESMRSKWNSELTGTNIVEALLEGIEVFNNDSNLHYLVLLTDGEDTTNKLLSKKNEIINNANNKNVKICIVGLGDNIDYVLMEIAEKTGGSYYNANDAQALDEIYSLLAASVNYNYIDIDGDNEADGIIQADSGFLPSINGFNFGNFGSTFSKGGNCYGMAAFAMLYYQNKLPTKLDSKTVAFRGSAEGYDLSNTWFKQGQKKLAEYKPTDEAISTFLYGRFTREMNDNGVYALVKDVHEKIGDIGEFYILDNHDENYKDIKKYESVILNLESDSYEKINKTDREFFRAISRLYITQFEDVSISFSCEPDSAFNELCTNLNSGVPSIITINDNSHAINAIRLIKCINSKYDYVIQVYDNNYPGEIKNIYVIRSKISGLNKTFSYTGWTNEYSYEFYYDEYSVGIDSDKLRNSTSVIISHPQI